MKTLDLIVPCYNEEEALPIFFETVAPIADGLADTAVRFLFVDDGSRDKTLAVLRDLAERDQRVRYISFSRNFGKEAAMLAGLRATNADYVGIIDADLQHDPNLIPEMLCAVSDEGYDIAAARRIDRTGESKVKSSFSKAFYKIINRISDANIEEGAQDYRIMKRKVVQAILSMPEYNRFSKGIFSWVGFNTKWFPHENRARTAGTSKWSFGSLATYAMDGIVNFSTAPLKISLFFGSVLSFVGIIYALYIIIRTLILGSDVPGYPSIISAILIIGGFILLFLGVLGEYISRIYMEVKNRPNYIIDETNIIPETDEKK
ncbi:MAG: glycosyltransferase family 2 protein [Candidatus Fimenecus sp.]